jgi:hypothetical protein
MTVKLWIARMLIRVLTRLAISIGNSLPRNLGDDGKDKNTGARL